MKNATSPETLGLVTLGGSLPVSLAQTLQDNGRPFYCVAFDNITSPLIKNYPHSTVTFFKIGQMVEALRKAGCRQILLVGQLYRPNILKMRFDGMTLRHLPLLLFARKGGDDSVLRRVTRAFEAQGFEMLSLKDVAPALVAQDGQLGHHKPSPAALADIKAGFLALKDLGRHDIGQCLVIDNGRIIAVEAAEGTDAMLARVQALRGTAYYPAKQRSGVLVKAAKPQQELRNDMPVIGLDTVNNAIAAGLQAVAVEAGRVVTTDLPDMVTAANRNDLAVLGFTVDASS